MADVLVVFGATGQQGGSVIDHVLQTPKLRDKYRIRAITRDVEGPQSQTLHERGVEVIECNLDDDASIRRAVAGGHAVFEMVRGTYDDQLKPREIRQSRAIADAAVHAGVEILIYSTALSCVKISDGRYPVDPYDAKAEVEDYIRTLPIKSSFFAPGIFMQNFAGGMKPRPTVDGTFEISNIHSPDARYPLLDVVADTGKYVGAILSDPRKYEGQTLMAASDILTCGEIADRMSAVTGKTIRYRQMSEEVYRSFLPAVAGDIVVNMFLFVQDHGHFGERGEELVERSNRQVGEDMTSLEKYLARNPLYLE